MVIIVNYSYIQIYVGHVNITRSYSILILSLILLLILSIINFRVMLTKDIFSLIFIIMSIINFYIFTTILFWLFSTTEGRFTFKFLEIIKTASYETKLDCYLSHLSMTIDTIKDYGFREYVIKSTMEHNPPQKEIIKTALLNIP